MKTRNRPYGRHPAEVTNDRLLDAYERWFDRLGGEERDAIGIVRNALHRIADEATAPRELHPCGTEAAYRRHLRNHETPDGACRDAHAQALSAYRSAKQ